VKKSLFIQELKLEAKSMVQAIFYIVSLVLLLGTAYGGAAYCGIEEPWRGITTASVYVIVLLLCSTWHSAKHKAALVQKYGKEVQ